MKKSIALLFAGALVTGFAFAGGIENKTNMSTGYLRNPSRNVEAARPEASFYNIAGTGFMETDSTLKLATSLSSKSMQILWQQKPELFQAVQNTMTKLLSGSILTSTLFTK